MNLWTRSVGADIDANALINSNDVTAFSAVYIAQHSAADVNHDNAIDPNDVTDFQQAYIAATGNQP